MYFCKLEKRHSPSFMNYIEEIKEPIYAEMQSFDRFLREELNSDNELLKEVHHYVMSVGGKRLRPMITILCAKLLGNVNDATLYGAAAIELLHTASLVHDDVVDDTLQRRSRASVNAKWTNKIAVLSGDYILAKSLNSASKTGKIEILQTISEIGMTLADGELLQLVNPIPSTTTEEEYFRIIHKKTAILFSSCAIVGGLSVGCSQQELSYLSTFGENIGLCFQIKDDIFDYMDSAEIGKPTGNDVRDGKVTLPLIYAIKTAPMMERNEIVKMIDNKEFSETNIQSITRFAHEYGGVKYGEETMVEYKEKARKALEKLPSSPIRKALEMCIDFVSIRQR